MNAMRARAVFMVASTALAAALWLAWALIGGDILLASGWAHKALYDAAVVATATAAVLVAGALVLSRAVLSGEVEPTGLWRVAVYGVLTFIASSIVFGLFGLDLGAVLTTSAIVTAAVGFAMQPTLGSMIAGLVIHLDRSLRIGDVVLFDKRPVRITALNWRTVEALTSEGRTIVFANSRFADGPLEVVPRGRATEAKFTFLAPADSRPQALREMVTDLMADLEFVDPGSPVRVSPTPERPLQPAVRYDVRYQLTDPIRADDVEGEAHHRLWYVFQRHRIPWPVTPDLTAIAQTSGLYALPPEVRLHMQTLIDPEGDAAATAAAALEAQGDVLLFAADERLVMPERTAGSVYLILTGEAVAAPDFEGRALNRTGEAERRIRPLGRTAAIKQVSEDLAGYIGPYAEFAVHRAAAATADFTELCRQVSLEIADPAARAKFLADVCPAGERLAGPGTVLHARRNAAGALVCGGGLRARGELAILALPPEAARGLKLSGPGAQEATPAP